MNTHISNKLIKGKNFQINKAYFKIVLPDPKNELIKFDKSEQLDILNHCIFK